MDNNSFVVFAGYAIGIPVGIGVLVLFTCLKNEIQEQRKFRRDFYSAIAKHDFDLYRSFYERDRN